jgi:hypothetical protein
LAAFLGFEMKDDDNKKPTPVWFVPLCVLFGIFGVWLSFKIYTSEFMQNHAQPEKEWWDMNTHDEFF